MIKHHKVLTCASYGGTGSSVVTDLLKEFENLKSLGEYEFSIAHDVDGISDLQHYIVDDNHRLKIDEAIYRFKKMVKHISNGYNPYFNNKFPEITQKYLDELIDVSWDGFWLQHPLRYGKYTRKFIYGVPGKIQRIRQKFFGKKTSYEFVVHYKRTPMHLSFARERFFDVTRRYFEELFDAIDVKQEYEYLVFDQLVPPSNTERYMKYFEDLKLIVVDRDPRDLYLLNKMFWGEGWIPSGDVKTFVTWFRLMREHLRYENEDPAKVMRINFEEFIFNYEETVDRVIKFLGISSESHTRKKEFFKPEVSIKNTRLWERFDAHGENIKYIEENLGEFCYSKK